MCILWLRRVIPRHTICHGANLAGTLHLPLALALILILIVYHSLIPLSYLPFYRLVSLSTSTTLILTLNLILIIILPPSYLLSLSPSLPHHHLTQEFVRKTPYSHHHSPPPYHFHHHLSGVRIRTRPHHPFYPYCHPWCPQKLDTQRW